MFFFIEVHRPGSMRYPCRMTHLLEIHKWISISICYIHEPWIRVLLSDWFFCMDITMDHYHWTLPWTLHWYFNLGHFSCLLIQVVSQKTTHFLLQIGQRCLRFLPENEGTLLMKIRLKNKALLSLDRETMGYLCKQLDPTSFLTVRFAKAKAPRS